MDSSEEGASVRHLFELGYEDPQEIAECRRREATLHEAKLDQARQLLDARSPAAAVALLEQIATKPVESPGLHWLLARAHFDVGNLNPALAELRWLETHGYERTEFALLRGSIALRQRRLREAIERAEYAHCLQQPCVQADILLGEAQYRLGDLSSAEASYRHALAEEGSNPSALAGLAAVALRRGKLEAAVDFALQALELNPRMATVHYRLGLALLRIERKQEAAAALNVAAQLAPQLAGPHRLLTLIYAGVDELKAAQHRSKAANIIAHRRANQ